MVDKELSKILSKPLHSLVKRALLRKLHLAIIDRSPNSEPNIFIWIRNPVALDTANHG